MKSDEIIREAVAVLRSGGVILYPTDTVWGIGCDATNSRAIDKISKIKNRPSDKKGLIILVDSIDSIKDYVKTPSPIVGDLIKSATNPLSIIYKESKGLAKNLSGDGSVCNAAIV